MNPNTGTRSAVPNVKSYMRYRRASIPGGTYFFTATLEDRRSRLLVERIDVLRKAVAYVRERHPFEIDAMVVLPDHIHTVWTLPDGDSDIATRWALIKAAFSRALQKTEYVSTARHTKGERGIWQRRYWEHVIRSDDDFNRHVDYIHYNPVKHGHAERPIDWQYSSIHRHVARNLLPADWASSGPNHPDFGSAARKPVGWGERSEPQR